MAEKLRIILGDQLNASHSWFQQQDHDVLYVIAEMHSETNYVRHHIQKLVAFFSAMRWFANMLREAGHQVKYLTLDDTAGFESPAQLIESLCKQHGVTSFEYQRPDEFRLSEQLRTLQLPGITVCCVESEHFILPHDEIGEYFQPGKGTRMETFYRKMRKRFDILMEGEDPVGGQWNFDADNRHKLKKQDLPDIPAPLIFSNDIADIMERLQRHDVDWFGDIGDSLLWPVNRQQSLNLLQYFCTHCLPRFGFFQDAMTADSDYAWSLYHSRLSFAMNAKIITPMEVIRHAIREQQARPEIISMAQIEGFIRQILGWREFMRGIYWANMPGYRDLNALAAERDLPAFFWNGDTKMRCMRHSLGQSLQYAYAHHIQRLMVIGNFCLLAGIEPDQVDAWYLGVYIDAIEWVEMPNTRGMSQFADGGLLASKPYAASGAYVNRMSDYCSSCHYAVKQKVGDKACPFNSLYWQFMHRHRDALGNNPRIGMVYRNWDKMDAKLRAETLKRADYLLANIESL